MFDQYDDVDQRQLHGFHKVLELPEFVKTASVSSAEDLLGLAPNCFGDPATRKFPLHTANDAWLSRLYFSKNAHLYKNASVKRIVGERIKQAEAFWKLEPEYIVKEAAEVEKVAFDIPIHNQNGDMMDKWVLKSPRDFEKAAIQMFEDKDLFSYKQRRGIARKMSGLAFAKVANLTPEVSEYMEKAAGYGMNSKEAVMDVLGRRAALYTGIDRRFADKVATFAEKVACIQDLDPSALDKVAELIDVCDNALGLTRHYKTGALKTPEEELFQFTEKVATEIRDSYISLTNGRSIPKTAFSEDQLNNYFDSVHGEIPEGGMPEKIAVLKSLPAPDADDLIKYLGIGKQAAASRILSDEEREDERLAEAAENRQEGSARTGAVKAGALAFLPAATLGGVLSKAHGANITDALIRSLAAGAGGAGLSATTSYLGNRP